MPTPSSSKWSRRLPRANRSAEDAWNAATRGQREAILEIVGIPDIFIPRLVWRDWWELALYVRSAIEEGWERASTAKPNPSSGKVAQAFACVREFVGQKFPALSRVAMDPFCQQIRTARKKASGRLSGRRYVAHVGHRANVVCLWSPAMARLSPGHLVGILLHEFGHIGSDGDDVEADKWVLVHFGIPIEYRGPLVLEWVGPEVVRRVGAR